MMPHEVNRPGLAGGRSVFRSSAAPMPTTATRSSKTRRSGSAAKRSGRRRRAGTTSRRRSARSPRKIRTALSPMSSPIISARRATSSRNKARSSGRRATRPGACSSASSRRPPPPTTTTSAARKAASAIPAITAPWRSPKTHTPSPPSAPCASPASGKTSKPAYTTTATAITIHSPPNTCLPIRSGWKEATGRRGMWRGLGFGPTRWGWRRVRPIKGRCPRRLQIGTRREQITGERSVMSSRAARQENTPRQHIENAGRASADDEHYGQISAYGTDQDNRCSRRTSPPLACAKRWLHQGERKLESCTNHTLGTCRDGSFPEYWI